MQLDTTFSNFRGSAEFCNNHGHAGCKLNSSFKSLIAFTRQEYVVLEQTLACGVLASLQLQVIYAGRVQATF